MPQRSSRDEQGKQTSARKKKLRQKIKQHAHDQNTHVVVCIRTSNPSLFSLFLDNLYAENQPSRRHSQCCITCQATVRWCRQCAYTASYTACTQLPNGELHKKKERVGRARTTYTCTASCLKHRRVLTIGAIFSDVPSTITRSALGKSCFNVE